MRFYIDRVDLNGQTKTLSSVNVPGSLLHVDATTNRIVTTDYRTTPYKANDWQDCYNQTNPRGQFDYDVPGEVSDSPLIGDTLW